MNLKGALRRAFLIKVIFSFWGEFLIESELLITFNSIEIYFSCQRTLGSSPNTVVNIKKLKTREFSEFKGVYKEPFAGPF
ncbi:hypothetical protein ASJ81_06260 [Methanosarcina spelaei]|uniref:Uncharacterized protein n=1 Tax=Methanosarcina spelaei TaxID=1036679 RepID=A0A2A2HT68_9EURY|nr:hypothetical protein ASJ81_06260 [Methanosarcina spelaei]